MCTRAAVNDVSTGEHSMRKRPWLIALALLGVAASVAATSWFDFGLFTDQQLRAHSEQLFGIVEPLAASSTASVTASQAEQDPTSLITVAKGLRVRVVTAAPNAGANIDMMALWPDDRHPTHLIVCNEQGPTNPGVQRVRLS